MKQCPCGHIFDDSKANAKWSDCDEERYVQCPKCRAWTLGDLLTLPPKESTDG